MIGQPNERSLLAIHQCINWGEQGGHIDVATGIFNQICYEIKPNTWVPLLCAWLIVIMQNLRISSGSLWLFYDEFIVIKVVLTNKNRIIDVVMSVELYISQVYGAMSLHWIHVYISWPINKLSKYTELTFYCVLCVVCFTVFPFHLNNNMTFLIQNLIFFTARKISKKNI